MRQTHWLIQGYDSQTKIYERRISIGQLTEKQVEALLKALVSKAGLTFNDIVGAFVKKRTRIANQLLAVNRDGPGPRFMCGGNPFFTARTVSDRGGGRQGKKKSSRVRA